MKLRYLLCMLLSLGYINAADLCTKDQCGVVDGSCQCYCSDKCGPRTVDKNNNDAPFYSNGQCFCQKRDLDNYVPNGCAAKEEGKDLELDVVNME